MPHGKAKWKRLSRKRDSSGDANYESIEESGIAILRINSFTPKDVGDYECRAENELGEQVGVVELALMCEFILLKKANLIITFSKTESRNQPSSPHRSRWLWSSINM